MNEFFDPPPTGALRLSRSYLERSGRAIERASRAPYGLTNSGTSGETTAGPYFHIDQQSLVFAVITAQPATDSSTEYTGYSWMERRPTADGGWAVPTPMLRGDNGSEGTGFSGPIAGVSRTSNVVQLTLSGPSGLTAGETITVAGLAGSGSTLNGTFTVSAASGSTVSYYLPGADIAFAADSGTTTAAARPRRSPAFDPNGDETIPVGTVVALARGYLHVSQQNAAGLSLVNAGDPNGGVTTDAEAAIDREWLIVSGGGVGGSVAHVRPTGRPFAAGGVRAFPAAVRVPDASGAGSHNGRAVWLIQEDGAPLDTRGLVTYTALRKRRAFTVMTCDGEEDRELWSTTESIVARDFDPASCEVVYTGVDEGDQLCDFLTMDGDHVTLAGDLIGV